MAYVIAAPEMMSAAATDLANIASNVNAAHMVAAAPTVAVIPAATDEVSTGIAHLFPRAAQDYQALAGKAAAFHAQFVQNLKTSAASYTSIEEAIASLLLGLNANVSSFGSALGGQIVNLLIATLRQLLNSPFFGPLTERLISGAAALLFLTVFLLIFVAFGIALVLQPALPIINMIFPALNALGILTDSSANLLGGRRCRM
jgi:hypothetical protein